MSLSENCIATVKATVPALRAHAIDITTSMYRTMVKDFPQVKNFFNMSHLLENTNGCPGSKASLQAIALGNSVLAYAENIDNLGALSAAVDIMVEKHVSFQVMPEHYVIVKVCLMGAIKEILGEAATDPIIEAWEEAYQFLADLLIAKEEELRNKRAAEKGGWKGYKPFLVSQKVVETELTTSFYLKPAASGNPCVYRFSPGQFISVRVPKGVLDPDFDVVRNYSLSHRPGEDFLRISVKKEEGNPPGLVSHHLHSNLKVGDELEIAIPCGSFVLDTSSSAPVVLMSGGIGVTPMMSMLEAILDTSPKRQVTFIQSVKGPHLHPMKKRVEYLTTQHSDTLKSYAFYTEKDNDDPNSNIVVFRGRVDKDNLAKILPECNESVFYYCGPLGYQTAMNRALKDMGVAEKNIHFESFGPTQPQ